MTTPSFNSMDLLSNSNPIVELYSNIKTPFVYCERKHDLPTPMFNVINLPESPNKQNLKIY